MKKIKIYLGAFFAMAIIAAVIVACDKNLDKTDPNAVTVDQYFKNSAELLAGTNAAYSAFHGGNLVGREWFFLHDTRSDEFASGGPQLEVPRFQLLTGVHDPTNSVMGSVWSALYTVIHRANTVIANAPNVTDNNTLRDRCVAEAKFLRAWAYFDLVSQWGPVPVYTGPVSNPTEFGPRMPEADVYAQILSDLNDAIPVLPPKGSTDNGRATNAAANVLLGRVQMQRGDYAAAKAALLAITGYSLVPRYLDNFEEETEFNNESIFEAVYFNPGDVGFNWGGNGVGDGTAGQQTTVRNQEYCPVAWRNLIPSDKYLEEFEKTGAPLNDAKTDPRFRFSVYESGDLMNNGTETLLAGDQNVYGSTVHGVARKISWRKFMLIYKQSKAFASSSNHPGGNNQRLMRYAEVLLMLAECENELNNIGPAVGYLNQIRARADVAMPAYPTTRFPVTTKDQVTRAIMHERMVELGGEELRNIDIARWRRKGYYPSVAPEPIPYFTAKHELLPLPQAEIDNNPKLGDNGIPKQNTGY
jgi:starch-binding outer membrane protein, SusD/RagB family